MVNKRRRFAVRWRRAGIGLRLGVFAVALALFIALIFLQQDGQESADSGGSFLIYSLVNLNVILLLVFAFLIGRNIVKLVFDRKRNIFGSKLRSRLVGAFVSLVIVPSIFIFLFASGLITRAMEGWFSEPVEVAITGAVDIAKTHFQVSKRYLQSVSEFSVDTVGSNYKDDDRSSQPPFQKLTADLEQIRKNWGLFSIRVLRFDNDQTEIEVFNPASTIENFAEPPIKPETYKEVQRPISLVQLEEKEARQFLRSYRSLTARGQDLVVVCTLRISPEMTQMMETVNSSYRRYEELKFYKGPIKFSNILTLALFTALLLFSAIWLAFYLARDLTGPIMRLAEATRFVAQGRYDFRLKEQGDDELGTLVKSFNQMTTELRSAQQQSEERRVHLETVLSSLAVGVISLDAGLRVQALNFPASRMLAVSDMDRVLGKRLWDILLPGFQHPIRALFESDVGINVDGDDSFVLEKQFSLDVRGQHMEILATVARTFDSSRRVNGYVLLFDDLTELARAQQFAAWRDVAQRVAHEIKNPLTPIQLSAQRLQRLEGTPGLSKEITDKISECSQTIVENVHSIKRLSDEFSRFTRMPRAEPEITDLNRLISDTIQTYVEGHPNVVFQFIGGSGLPDVKIDREQIRRCLINLVDNALEALRNDSGNQNPRVVVQTNYDAAMKKVLFEVQDNGPGVKPEAKGKIFEPHVSSKPEGGGLGLAIVSSILVEHEGAIRVYDHLPRGARFVVELPVLLSQRTLRRFG